MLTGKIVNRDSIPVSNGIIFLDGQNSNIMSNSKGEFRIRFKPDVKKVTFYSIEDGVFEIDYVGQQRLEITMNQQSSILPINPSIDQDVVEVGYGKVSEDDLVGSVTRVKNDKSTNRVYGNIYDMIVGTVPGVTV